MEALNNSMQDNGNALQEKYALTRELNRLRPEIDHLRSQLSNHQAVVAEKNDLRRQLDSLEVDFENEKRSHQRARAKEENEAANESRPRLEELERSLTAEKKGRENTKRLYEQKLATATNKYERSEEIIATLRSKLESTEVDLEDTENKLATCQAALERATATVGLKSQSISSLAKPLRKRRAQEAAIDDMSNIGTPGNDDIVYKRAAKRRIGVEQTLMGEKSTFSITPFLNRTKHLDEEEEELPTPSDAVPVNRGIESSEDQAASEPAQEESEPVLKPTTVEIVELNVETVRTEAVDEDFQDDRPAIFPRKPRGRPKAQATAEAPVLKKNPSTQTRENGASKGLKSSVDSSKPEDSTRNGKESATGTRAYTVSLKISDGGNATATADGSAAEAKKKKRKLLGGTTKTTFEDDEVDPPARPANISQGLTRKPQTMLRGSVSNALAKGPFSPLKKERRGREASFLA